MVIFPSFDLSQCYLGFGLTQEKNKTNFEWLTAAAISYWTPQAHLCTRPDKRSFTDQCIEVDLENEDIEIPEVLNNINANKIEIMPDFQDVIFTCGFHKIIRDRLQLEGQIIIPYSTKVTEKLESFFIDYIVTLDDWSKCSQISRALEKSMGPLKDSWNKYCPKDAKILMEFLENDSKAIILTKSIDSDGAARSWEEFQSNNIQSKSPAEDRVAHV